MNFLKNLTHLMEINNMSRNDLAKAVGIAPSTVNSWFNRGYENISLKTLLKLSRFFNITIDELVDGSIADNYKEINEIKRIRELLKKYENKLALSSRKDETNE